MYTNNIFMQHILTENEQSVIKSLTNYSSKVNHELEKACRPRVRPNLIHQVVGGFHENMDIYLACKKVLSQYPELING